MTGPARRELIPALQDIIVKACPVAESFAYETIQKWTDGGEADTPVEKAVFEVIDHVVADMDAQADAEPDLDDQEVDVRWNVTFVSVEDEPRNQTLAVMWPADDRLGAGRKAERHVLEAWSGEWKVLSIDRDEGGEA